MLVKVIRDIAESADLEEGRTLVLNKYVTDVHYNETGETPVKVISKDTKTGKMTIFRAKWTIITFRSDKHRVQIISRNNKLRISL